MRLGPEFDDFVRDASPRLLRTAYLLTGDYGHAEDLVQAALLGTAKHWGRAIKAPNAYARTAVVNLAKDRWRHRGRHPECDQVPEVADVTDEAQEVVVRDQLMRAVARLPARQRAVLVLRYFEDLSVEEVARTLGCTTGTVKSQTHDALRTVRRRINDQSIDDRSIDHQPTGNQLPDEARRNTTHADR